MCGPNNRERYGAGGYSIRDCKDKCVEEPDCNAVEYWAGDNSCYKCIDPSQHHPYIYTSTPGYPPSVHQLGIDKKLVLTVINCTRMLE